MTNRVCFLFWRGRGLFARGNVFFLAGYISLLVGRGLIEIFEHAYHLQIFSGKDPQDEFPSKQDAGKQPGNQTWQW
jgi:hypothetical protein